MATVSQAQNLECPLACSGLDRCADLLLPIFLVGIHQLQNGCGCGEAGILVLLHADARKLHQHDAEL